MPNHSDRDAMGNLSARQRDIAERGSYARRIRGARRADRAGRSRGARPVASPLGPHPSYHGRTVSWVAVGLMVGRLHHRRPGAHLRPRRADLVGCSGLAPAWPCSACSSPSPPTCSRTGTKPPTLPAHRRRRPGAGSVGSAGYARIRGRSPAPAPELKLTPDDVRLLTLAGAGADRGAGAGRAASPAHAPQAGRRPARHDQRARPLARAGRLRPARRGIPRRRSSARTGIRVRPPRSSTGRTPPACCRSRSGRTTRSGGASSAPGASAGTTATRRSATRCSPSCGPRDR